MTPAEQRQERTWPGQGWGRFDGVTAEYRAGLNKPEGIGWFPVSWVYRKVGEKLETVQAELEMCQRYFPFLQRSRADYKRRLEECQQSRDATQAVRAELEEGLARCERERDAAGVEADEQRRERQAAETARDEAVKREKRRTDELARLRGILNEEERRRSDAQEALENALAADTESEARHIIYAALDQSRKGARR